MREERIHYTVYKITNKLNGKIYIGIHTTLNLMDSYLGSGTDLLKAIKVEGRKNFYKEILFDFETEKEMLDKEAEIVNRDFILRDDTYNRALGGKSRGMPGRVSVRDKEGNTMSVSLNDPLYLSGVYVGVTKGKVVVQDREGNTFQVSKDDPRFLSGELIGNRRGKSLPEETKRKISISHTGKIKTAEHQKKINEANRGKKRPPQTEETKRKRFEIMKGQHRTEETKRKMREAWKIRKINKPMTEETKRKISIAKTKKEKLSNLPS